jgi:hypothetical protein
VGDDREWYRMLAAVRSREARPDPGWRDTLRASLATAAWRECLDGTGELRSGGRPIGRYQFLEVSTVEARWGGTDWFEVESPCRFVGLLASRQPPSNTNSNTDTDSDTDSDSVRRSRTRCDES